MEKLAGNKNCGVELKFQGLTFVFNFNLKFEIEVEFLLCWLYLDIIVFILFVLLREEDVAVYLEGLSNLDKRMATIVVY